MRVSCPTCGNGYVLDEKTSGQEFVCPACATPIAVERPAAAVAPAERSDHGEVLCPRCKLRFDPREYAATWSGPAQPTVLIVEHEGFFLKTAEEALSDRFEVRTANSAPEALAVLAGGGIDLMVLDISLNGADQGAQLLREFGRKPCPILIFTDQAEQELYGDQWEELRKLGADDIVIQGMHVAESLARKAGALLGIPTGHEDEIT